MLFSGFFCIFFGPLGPGCVFKTAVFGGYNSEGVVRPPPWRWLIPKNRGILPPEMDGENKGKSLLKLDDLGGKPPLFLETYICTYLARSHQKLHVFLMFLATPKNAWDLPNDRERSGRCWFGWLVISILLIDPPWFWSWTLAAGWWNMVEWMMRRHT